MSDFSADAVRHGYRPALLCSGSCLKGRASAAAPRFRMHAARLLRQVFRFGRSPEKAVTKTNRLEVAAWWRARLPHRTRPTQVYQTWYTSGSFGGASEKPCTSPCNVFRLTMTSGTCVPPTCRMPYAVLKSSSRA